jgi:hypothetical protein
MIVVGDRTYVSVFAPAVGDVDKTLSVFALLGLEKQINFRSPVCVRSVVVR